MIRETGNSARTLREVRHQCDLAVAGGGLAGVCAAITAARAGLRVVLLQDRPVLGGNASSEVRLWILGATSHMGNNNRWAREGGIIDEFMVENTWRNKEGNPVLVDPLLLEMVSREPRITLLLNTAVYEVEKKDPDTISALRAFSSQTSTRHFVSAPLFCDATGDGIVGFQAGAAFRMGAESKAEFGEGLAPEEESKDLLGHSIYFYTRDTGTPVRFVPPSFALRDVKKRIPRIHTLKISDHGCRLWWIEYGGRLDTIHETENIKWELWKIIYGVWDHVKNSGEYEGVESLTLDWVGMIPGKRESRRFEGPYMLKQQDIVKQQEFPDAVSFGGWAIDHHPPDGVYSSGPGCEQWHAKGVYQIPYSCQYSRNIRNLFLGGRLISTSHIAFGSTRVMATCGHNAQVVGMAAALCLESNVLPCDLQSGPLLHELRERLARLGQYIPNYRLQSDRDLARQALITVSSTMELEALPAGGDTIHLDHHLALMVPVVKGTPPVVTFLGRVEEKTTLEMELRISEKPGNHTPDICLEKISIAVERGSDQNFEAAFKELIPHDCYAFYTIRSNPHVALTTSDKRVSGILTIYQAFNKAVAKTPIQEPPEGSGVDRFEYWTPKRRPGGRNPAVKFSPPLSCFDAENLVNGILRPVSQPNVWVSAPDDERPWVRLSWDTVQMIRQVDLWFDTDLDHPMESVLMGHPEDLMPFCVEDYTIEDGEGRAVHAVVGNHQTRNRVVLAKPLETKALTIRFKPRASGASLFGISCWENEGI